MKSFSLTKYAGALKRDLYRANGKVVSAETYELLKLLATSSGGCIDSLQTTSTKTQGGLTRWQFHCVAHVPDRLVPVHLRDMQEA